MLHVACGLTCACTCVISAQGISFTMIMKQGVSSSAHALIYGKSQSPLKPKGGSGVKDLKHGFSSLQKLAIATSRV
jgi:hypothetical protein